MGNIESHGHSHDGKPCHGHGNDAPAHTAPAPAQQAASHGHSHGGKPCHGHGGPSESAAHSHSHGGHNHQAAPQPPKNQDAAHGHSHGGKPCHGHGGAADHGHSHGASDAGHGHNHGGNPSREEMLNSLPQHMQQRVRAVQLMMTTMIGPKLPVIFEKFHPSKDVRPSKVTSAGIAIPDNSHEIMSTSEFRDFVSAYLSGIAEAEGHGVLRSIDVDEMVEGLSKKIPNGDVPQPMMLQLINFVLSRTAMSNFTSLKHILAHLGVEMKLPKLPLTPEEAMSQTARDYCREEILPYLVKHIEEMLDAAGDSEEAPIKVIDAVRTEIITGLTEAKSANPVIQQIQQRIEAIEASQLVDEFKSHPSEKTIHAKLFAHFINEALMIHLFIMEPTVAVPIVRNWNIELDLVAEEPEKL